MATEPPAFSEENPDNDLHDPKVFDTCVVNRCAYIDSNFEQFKNRLSALGHRTEYFLHEGTLFTTVTSYFYDIMRLKDFHGMSPGVVDRFKIAGYSMYWISKHRPVQLINHTDLTSEEEKLHLTINEAFALTAGCNAAGISPRLMRKDDAKFAREFIYNLRYRNVDGNALAQMMYLAERLWPKSEPEQAQ